MINYLVSLLTNRAFIDLLIATFIIIFIVRYFISIFFLHKKEKEHITIKEESIKKKEE